jgi:hypothetical protein
VAAGKDFWSVFCFVLFLCFSVLHLWMLKMDTSPRQNARFSTYVFFFCFAAATPNHRNWMVIHISKNVFFEPLLFFRIFGACETPSDAVTSVPLASSSLLPQMLKLDGE